MPLAGPVSTVTNIEAANCQLRTAIQLFFADCDPVSVHTLATAAREIYEKHCIKAGLGGLFDFGISQNQRRLWDDINEARNFFKHPAESIDQSIAFDDTDNDFHLHSACMDCASLLPTDYPREAHAFLLWNLAVADLDMDFAHRRPDDAKTLRLFLTAMDDKLPGLRKAPRVLKKRWGAGLLQYVLSQSLDDYALFGHTLRRIRQILLQGDTNVPVLGRP
jgi:hypothetical protein